MRSVLPKPFKEAMIYEDSRLYVCLANYPIVKGHTIIVWKKSVPDLHLLSKNDYRYLMDKVDEVRNALLKTLKIQKVYLTYLDEVKRVHWHLVPRFNVKGYNLFLHRPKLIHDFSLAKKIRNNLRKI